MYTIDDSNLPKFSQEEESNSSKLVEANDDIESETEVIEPPLDEEDLEELDLTVEEADRIVWDAPKTGSSGPEEKDITD